MLKERELTRISQENGWLRIWRNFFAQISQIFTDFLERNNLEFVKPRSGEINSIG